MHISDYLSPAEFKAITQTSDLSAGIILLINWLMIAICFVLVYYFPNVVVILIALFVLGSRQLGLGILMHECGHGILFRTASLNLHLGQWLCAYPIFAELHSYASGHRQHHKLAGSDQDPDLPNYQAFPVPVVSLKRKMIRDLTGQTGFSLIKVLLKGEGDFTSRASRGDNHLLRAFIVNGLLFIVLALTLSPWLYLLWVGAFLTTFTWCSRIRQIAEHGAVADLEHKDPRMHTRTTLGNWIERLLFCPNHVNYHCEHHLAPTVPSYRLAELHRMLRERGYYEGYDHSIANGYLEVLKLATTE